MHSQRHWASLASTVVMTGLTVLTASLAVADARTLATADDAADRVPIIKPEPEEKKAWMSKLKRMTLNSLADAEEFADTQWSRFTRHLGLNEPRHIANYKGYGNGDSIWVVGRVLANRPMGGPQDDDDWFDNLKSSYNRWNSREVAGVPVELRYHGTSITVTTDNEGYYQARLDRNGPAVTQDKVYAEVRAEGQDTLAAVHTVYSPAPSADLLVISDMDDTVIHTGITDLLVAAQLTFLNNAKTRKPLSGVGSLYRALRDGADGNKRNPIFYVSNSGWNMYDLLRDFIDLNELPAGPIMLRDLGLNRVGEGSENHKIDTIRMLLSLYSDLPVILVGDSGQHDADIYASIAKEFPGRLRAVYIRDIDPDHDSAFDAKVDAIIKDSAGTVPFLRVADSSLIAAHAQQLGLLSEKQVAKVTADTFIDEQRDSLAEEALEEAVALQDGEQP